MHSSRLPGALFIVLGREGTPPHQWAFEVRSRSRVFRQKEMERLRCSKQPSHRDGLSPGRVEVRLRQGFLIKTLG